MSAFEIMIVDRFSAAHQLRNFGGKCEELHGHNYKVEVIVRGHQLDPDTGLLLDFGVLKEKTAGILSRLDHSFLNQLPIFQEQDPSAEHIARYLFLNLKNELQDSPVRLQRVQVWESETSRAAYSEEEE